MSPLPKTSSPQNTTHPLYFCEDEPFVKDQQPLKYHTSSVFLWRWALCQRPAALKIPHILCISVKMSPLSKTSSPRNTMHLTLFWGCLLPEVAPHNKNTANVCMSLSVTTYKMHHSVLFCTSNLISSPLTPNPFKIPHPDPFYPELGAAGCCIINWQTVAAWCDHTNYAQHYTSVHLYLDISFSAKFNLFFSPCLQKTFSETQI